MRRNNDRTVFPHTADQGTDLTLLIRIEPVRGFIHHKHFGGMHDRLRQADPPFESFGKRLDLLGLHRFQSAFFNGRTDSLRQFPSAEPAHTPAVYKKGTDRHASVKRRIFREVADLPLCRNRIVQDACTVDQHIPRGGRHDSAKHPHGSGLAGSVGADEAEHGMFVERETHILDGYFVSVILAKMFC